MSMWNPETGYDYARQWEKLVDRSAGHDACWPWQGVINDRGYGRYSTHQAHRLTYETYVGPIPEGLQLDHLCRNRSCVNPAHLEPVTAAENIRRGHIARGTLGGRTDPERRAAAHRRYRERKRAERGPAPPPYNTLKTHCPQGHPYDEANTYVIPSTGSRSCLICKRARRKVAA